MSEITRSPSLDSLDQNGFLYKKTKIHLNSEKIFCDPVHGQIPLHPACILLIDTPQFQRLRNIKQTGFLDYVYPGATHNRFSHSLGVCHLAGKFVGALRERQPELAISDTDILCVRLAGLCHDLGHGPYSHTWERYINVINRQKNEQTKWRHELMSCIMLDYLIEENNLNTALEEFGIGSNEIKLVKDFICGVQPKDGSKAFLYQIVNNDDSGLDVDKWDYFLRDCHYLGLPCNFEYERLIQFAKVFIVDGKSQICFRDKVLECAYNVFRTRSNLHRLAYNHKVVIIIEKMILDAFSIIDGKSVAPNGEVMHFWEWSMEAATARGDARKRALKRYCMLTDSVVFEAMKHASRPDTLAAADILRSVEKRSAKGRGFYQHVGMKILPYYVEESEIVTGLCNLLPAANERIVCARVGNHLPEKPIALVTAKDICVWVVPVHWGQGDKNPVDSVHFYSKNSVFRHPSVSDVSAALPKSFQEIQVHVMCRRGDPFALQVARWCFENFWNCSPLRCNGNSG